VAGQHTLDETERQVQARLGDLKIDFEAMAVASNLFRAANAVRNYLERTVLAQHDLSWTAFVSYGWFGFGNQLNPESLPKKADFPKRL